MLIQKSLIKCANMYYALRKYEVHNFSIKNYFIGFLHLKNVENSVCIKEQVRSQL